MRRLHVLSVVTAAVALSGVAATGALAAGCGTDETTPSAEPMDAQAGVTDAPVAPAALCVDGEATVPYPPGPHAVGMGKTVPDLVLAGESGPVRLAESFEPCAARSRLLVVRTSTLWCGTCAWHASHTNALVFDPSLAGRITLLDLLVADEDNMPATVPALARLRSQLDVRGDLPLKLAVDPTFSFRAASGVLVPLPTYVVIDTKTMQLRATATNPDPEALRAKLLVTLAALDGAPPPQALPAAKTTDGFTDYQLDLVRAMKTPGAPPPDPTNEYADVPAAAELGKKLFSDAALSPSNRISCATCHDAAKGLSDGLPQSEGIATTDRNAPAIALASHARWQFWDGRADTLWMQALGPFEAPKEYASSRLFVAHQIAERYAAEYAAVFPKYPLPDLSDAARFPAAGKPGDPSWQGMTAADRDAVTRVYVDVGKAIAAFERTLRVKPNALDLYAGGDTTALTPPQKKGLAAFFEHGCVQCHHGPRLTDDAFHVIRFPTGILGGAPDRGRSDGLPLLLGAEFTADKKWSDAPGAARSFLGLDKPPPSMVGAFKTPTLRALPKSGPYGHGGKFATLAEVTKHYGGRGLPHDDPRSIGATEPWVPLFEPPAQEELVPFLEVLTGDLAD